MVPFDEILKEIKLCSIRWIYYTLVYTRKEDKGAYSTSISLLQITLQTYVNTFEIFALQNMACVDLFVLISQHGEKEREICEYAYFTYI